MKKTILALLIFIASIGFAQVTKAPPYWRPFSVYVTLTRPADTVSYANNTVISNSKTQASSNLLKIPGCAAQAGGRGIVTNITLVCDTPNVHAVRARLTNDSVNVPRIADGSPYRLSDSTMSVFVGATNHYFSTALNGAGSTAVREQVNIPGGYSFVCPAGSTSLYARFEEIGAATLLYKPKLSGKIGVLVEGMQLVVP